MCYNVLSLLLEERIKTLTLPSEMKTLGTYPHTFRNYNLNPKGVLVSNIVHIQKNDLVVSIQDMADFSGTESRSIENLIRTHSVHFEKLGLETKLKGKYRDFKSQLFNEPQATFLITLMRNTTQVTNFKISLVMEFYRMRELLCEVTRTQLQIQKSTIQELKQNRYAKPKDGDYQLVDRIRQDYNISCSTQYLNFLLVGEGLMDIEYHQVAHYVSTSNVVKNGKSPTVFVSALLDIVDDVGIKRGLGFEDINQRLDLR